MGQQFGWNGLPLEDACSDRVRDRQLQAAGVVADIEIARRALVKAVDDLAEVTAGEVAVLPPLESFGDAHERSPQLLFVRGAGILTEQALDPLGRVCHTSWHLTRRISGGAERRPLHSEVRRWPSFQRPCIRPVLTATQC